MNRKTMLWWSAGLVALPLVMGCASSATRESRSVSPVRVSDSDSKEPTGDPFADRVVSFEPGESAGFGQKNLPQVVLGPPQGAGARMGSLNVLSLGRGGSIVVEFTDIELVDGPGIDLLVFENPFESSAGRFMETGVVAVSEDGRTWHEFPCDTTRASEGYPGCAGVRQVYASPENNIPATDPAVAGGDGFDLSTLGVARARFVRIRDTGANEYDGISGGFDLDAVAVVNGRALSSARTSGN